MSHFFSGAFTDIKVLSFNWDLSVKLKTFNLCVCVVRWHRSEWPEGQSCHLRALWPAMPSVSLGNQRPLLRLERNHSGPWSHSVCVCWQESFLTGWEVLVWETVIPRRPCGGPSVRSWMLHVSDPCELQLELARGHVCLCMYHWCCTVSEHVTCCPPAPFLPFVFIRASSHVCFSPAERQSCFWPQLITEDFQASSLGSGGGQSRVSLTWWMLLSPN